MHSAVARKIYISALAFQPYECFRGDNLPYLSYSGGFHAYGDGIHFQDPRSCQAGLIRCSSSNMTIQQYEKQTLMGNALLNLDLQPIVNGAGVNLAAPQPPPRVGLSA